MAIDLDGVLGDTRPLWRDWLEDAARRYRSIAPLDPGRLPEDRSVAAEELDRWAEAEPATGARRSCDSGRPSARTCAPTPRVSAALRALAAAGHRLGVFTDAPEGLARVAVAQLGVDRRIEALEAGEDALERLRARFRPDLAVAGNGRLGPELAG